MLVKVLEYGIIKATCKARSEYMKICGLTKTTLLDYPGKVATTIFIGGCNFRCSFCHNGDLVLHSKEIPEYSIEEVLAFLKKRKNVLQGVCITGGEPTLYEELPEFLQSIKELGYQVKLDTNGTNPDMLEKVIRRGSVDYIAMDIKASVDKYQDICKTEVNMENIKRSVKILLEGRILYEFRTTLVKEFHTVEDLEKIGMWIKGAENYYLQNYQETENNISCGYHSFGKSELELMKKRLQKYVKLVEIRGVE